MLAIFALLLRPLRVLPEIEYLQLLRVPSWFVVVIGLGISLLSAYCCRQVIAGSLQIFIGLPENTSSIFMIDAYTLWSFFWLGLIMAVTAWLPAARRCLVPRVLPYCMMILLACWFALMMIASVNLALTLICWLALFSVAVALWAILFCPDWRWANLEFIMVLGLSALLGTIGMLMLRGLTQHAELSGMWSALLSSSPRAANSALMLIILGWLGPAIYLPWWFWPRKEEEAMVWTPVFFLLAVTSVLALVRLLFFAIPPGTSLLMQSPGGEYMLIVAQLMRWVSGWGIAALLLGSGWLLYSVYRRFRRQSLVLRPIVIVAAGLLLTAIAASLSGQFSQFPLQRLAAVRGLFWALPMWFGLLALLLLVKNMLPVLSKNEKAERRSLLVSLVLVFAMLGLFPMTVGFHAIRSFWSAWKLLGSRPEFIVILLLISALSALCLFLPWTGNKFAAKSRPGAGWGTIAPVLLALSLLVYGILAAPLSPLMKLLCQSLLQSY